MSRDSFRAIVRVSLGTILTISACLKMDVAPPVWFCATVSSPSSAWVLVVLLELLLGLLLLTATCEHLTFVVSTAFFLAMAILATALVLMGEPSCACLGRVQVSPAYAAGFHALAALMLIGALCIAFPARDRGEGNSGDSKCPSRFPLLASGLILFVALFGVLLWGSSWLNGPWVRFIPGAQRFQVQPSVWAGSGVIGETIDFVVSVNNYSDIPVTICGAETSCALRISDHLPLQVPAGGSLQVRGRFFLGARPGLVARQLRLFTTMPRRMAVDVVVSGRALAAAGS